MKGPFLCPCFVTGCGSPSGGEAAASPGWGWEVGGAALESPEDKRTATRRGAGRRGRAGRPHLPRAAALRALMETVQRRGLGSLLSPSALLYYPREWCWRSWGPCVGGWGDAT